MRCGILALCLAGLVSGVAQEADARPRTRENFELLLSRNGNHTFKDISAATAKVTPGRILRIRISRRSGRTVYAVRVLRPDGRRRDVFLDSNTLAVVEK